MMLNNNTIVIYLVVFLMALGAFTMQALEIKELESRVHELQSKLTQERVNYIRATEELEEQNLAIEALAVDYAQNIEELEAWKSKEERVRYETVYRYIEKEVKSNECEDIKNSINAIRGIDFKLL